MCRQVLGSPATEEPSEATKRLWREHHRRILLDLIDAGVPVCRDATDAYIADRSTWDGPLAVLTTALMYAWPEALRATPGAIPRQP
jgi:hypothetical protein